jgi:hypothetical protein
MLLLPTTDYATFMKVALSKESTHLRYRTEVIPDLVVTWVHFLASTLQGFGTCTDKVYLQYVPKPKQRPST